MTVLLLAGVATGQALLVQVCIEDRLEHVPVLGVLGDQRLQLGDPGASVRDDPLVSLQVLRLRNLACGQDQSPR